MADKKPNGFPPVKVEQRGRFTIITGDDADPRYQRVVERVRNRHRTGIGPAQYLSESSSTESIPDTSGSPPQTLAQPLASALQPQNVPNLDPSSVPSTSSSQTHSASDTQHQPVPDSDAGPLRRVASLTSPLDGSGSGSEPRSDSIRSVRSGPPFASLSMAFFSPQPQQTPSLQIQTPQFQFQPSQQQLQFPQMQMQLQVPQPQILLYTKEKAPAGWSTKFEDLHQDSQKVLLQIEERLRVYRDESEKLDQCTRLYDLSVSDDSFEVDAARIVQEIASTNTGIEREKASVQELVTSIKNMIRSTELAVHTYMILRPRFVRPATEPAQNNSTSATQPANQIVPAAPPMPVFDFYSGVPKRPSAFMQHTVERLQKFLEECVRWIEELEQLVQIDANRRCSDSLEALPKVMSNVHDYFVYVASKVSLIESPDHPKFSTSWSMQMVSAVQTKLNTIKQFFLCC